MLALAAGAALTIWAHLFVCIGLDPEGVYAADAIAPYLAIVIGTLAVAPAGPRKARAIGAWIAGILVFLWFVAFATFQARFALPAWPKLVFARLTASMLLEWAAAIIVGCAAGLLAERMRSLARYGTLVILLSVTPLVMAASVRSIPAHEAVSAGVAVDRFPPDPEGTIGRVVTCDFAREPALDIGVYDVDSDDDRPNDDRCAAYYGQPASAVWQRLDAHLRARGRSVRCLLNGGFFGANKDFVGFHIAPIVANGRMPYHAHTLSAKWKDQACTFVYRRPASRFDLISGDIHSSAGVVTALAGLRKLRVHGVSMVLKPGLGGTTLRCSRTSIGWNDKDNKLFILIVREPDGEAGSIRQRDAHVKATGGWDVRQVQEFWEERGVENAILFDGGESTQLVTPEQSVRAANHAAYTLGYWRGRPIRVYVPVLPPAQNTPGVLNYLYVDGPRR